MSRLVVVNGDCGCTMQPVIGEGTVEALFMCKHSQVNVRYPEAE